MTTLQTPQDANEATIGAVASTAVLGAWFPIETAPKDGTEILVHTKYGNFYVVSYDDVFSAPWRVRNDEGLGEKTPTHWMPLPEAPNGGGAQLLSNAGFGAAGFSAERPLQRRVGGLGS